MNGPFTRVSIENIIEQMLSENNNNTRVLNTQEQNTLQSLKIMITHIDYSAPVYLSDKYCDILWMYSNS